MVHALDPLRAPVRRGLQNGVAPGTLRDYLLQRLPEHIRLGGVEVHAHDVHEAWEQAQEVWLLGEFDIDGFAPQLGECSRVLDIGAGIGIYAMLAGSRAAHVTSYEPDPDRFADLVENTRKWDVTCRCAAVTADTAADALAGEWDLVHFDCGGAEFEIVAGAGDALANARRLIGRAHPERGDVDALLRDLEAAGFRAELQESRAKRGSVLFTGLRD